MAKELPDTAADLVPSKDAERHMVDLALVRKHTSAYRQLKPLNDKCRQLKDKEKFLWGHESEIILFEASVQELKKLGAVPLPSAEGMKKELTDLAARKEALYAEYTAARSGAKEYETIKQNVDVLLPTPKKQEQQKHHELE